MSATTLAVLREQGQQTIQTQGIDEFKNFIFKHKAQMKALLPDNISPDRVITCTLRAFNNGAKNMHLCDMNSIVGAAMECAALGLEPNSPLEFAYIIPYGLYQGKDPKTGKSRPKKYVPNVIFGYRGLIDLVTRTGRIIKVKSELRYENEVFEEDLSRSFELIRHVPIREDDQRGELKGAYAVATHITGARTYFYMTRKEIEEIRDEYSPGAYDVDYRTRERTPNMNHPWFKRPPPMFRKTAIRHMQKELPGKNPWAAGAIHLENLAVEKGHQPLDNWIKENRLNVGDKHELTPEPEKPDATTAFLPQQQRPAVVEGEVIPDNEPPLADVAQRDSARAEDVQTAPPADAEQQQEQQTTKQPQATNDNVKSEQEHTAIEQHAAFVLSVINDPAGATSSQVTIARQRLLQMPDSERRATLQKRLNETFPNGKEE